MTVAEAKASIPISALWRQLGLPGTPGPRCNSPFRTDTKPSMSISADDTLWFDHGTGEGGDAVTFLEKA
jgi:DNA primase